MSRTPTPHKRRTKPAKRKAPPKRKAPKKPAKKKPTAPKRPAKKKPARKPAAPKKKPARKPAAPKKRPAAPKRKPARKPKNEPHKSAPPPGFTEVSGVRDMLQQIPLPFDKAARRQRVIDLAFESGFQAEALPNSEDLYDYMLWFAEELDLEIYDVYAMYFGYTSNGGED